MIAYTKLYNPDIKKFCTTVNSDHVYKREHIKVNNIILDMLEAGDVNWEFIRTKCRYFIDVLIRHHCNYYGAVKFSLVERIQMADNVYLDFRNKYKC